MQLTSANTLVTTPDAHRPLPDGWRWVRLGDVAEYVNGCAFKPEDWRTSGVPIVRIQNLTSKDAPFNYCDVEVDPAYLVNDGDLLISWSASLDAFMWDRGRAILNQHIFKVVERTEIIRRDYLYFAVREVMSEIRAQVHGSTMQHVIKPEFEAILIPLPPLPEQRRIAAILREQMAAVDRARAAAAAQLAAAKALPAAYLRAVFESDEAREWPSRLLGDICEIPGQYGISERTSTEPLGVPVLGMGNIREGQILWGNLKYISVGEPEVRKYRLASGDILFNRTNSAELVGKAAVFEGARDAIFASYLVRFRVDPTAANPWYVSFYINSHAGRAFIEANMARAIGQVNLSASTACRMSIPLPPLPEQHRIAAMLTEHIAGAERARKALEEQLEAINQLPAALLRRAFNGEL
jgi:type I restriction enzyme S subunit